MYKKKEKKNANCISKLLLFFNWIRKIVTSEVHWMILIMKKRCALQQ
jgi:hypothetical protein